MCSPQNDPQAVSVLSKMLTVAVYRVFSQPGRRLRLKYSYIFSFCGSKHSS